MQWQAQKTALNSTEHERTKALADMTCLMCLQVVVKNISEFLMVICVKVSCNCFHSQGRPGSKTQKAPNKDKRKDSGKGKDKVCGPMYLNGPQDVLIKNRI